MTWLEHHISPASASQVWLIVVSVAIAAVGVWLQLYGGYVSRGVALVEEFEAQYLEQGPQFTLAAQEQTLNIFERSLVADWGSTLNSVGILITFASVVASIGIGFPEHWRRFVIIIPATLLLVAYGFLWSLRQLRAKRTRMQNLFDHLPSNPFPAGQYPSGRRNQALHDNRAVFIDRMPSLANWQSLSKARKLTSLVMELSAFSRLYLPLEHLDP